MLSQSKDITFEKLICSKYLVIFMILCKLNALFIQINIFLISLFFKENNNHNIILYNI